jgi:hypothetical protein
MLAVNFLSAEELEISKRERDALIRLLAMMEREEFVHVPLDIDDDYSGERGFNMSDYDHETFRGCGTVCCIAGWSDRLFGTHFVYRHGTIGSINGIPSLPVSLNHLFSGPKCSDSCTVAEAATALRNYLTTGAPAWR